MVQVAVFDPATGKIRQIVSCARQHAHQQHHEFPGHDFVDVTGQHHRPHPDKHAIHLGTKRLMVKPIDLDEVRLAKRKELEGACRSAIHTAMMDPAVDDFMAFRTHRLSLLAALLAKLDSATDVAGVHSINWG